MWPWGSLSLSSPSPTMPQLLKLFPKFGPKFQYITVNNSVSTAKVQSHKKQRFTWKPFLLRREKSQDKFWIISLYQIEITTLTALFLTVYFLQFSLTLSIFLLSISLAGTSPLFSTSSNGRMAFLIISSSFPYFLSFTLFKSSHNKCKPLTLTLLQPKSLSSALP